MSRAHDAQERQAQDLVFALNGSIADIAAMLFALPVDGIERGVGAFLCSANAIAAGNYTEYAAAAGNNLAVLL